MGKTRTKQPITGAISNIGLLYLTGLVLVLFIAGYIFYGIVWTIRLLQTRVFHADA